MQWRPQIQLRVRGDIRKMLWKQDRLHNLYGPMQNENARPLAQILRWRWQSIKPSTGPFSAQGLCDRTHPTPTVQALLRGGDTWAVSEA